VAVSDDMLVLISRTCSDLGVDGMRGDIVVYRASRALAALETRTAVEPADVCRAVELGLPHRRRRRDAETRGADRRRRDELPPPGAGPDERDQPPADANSENGGADASAADRNETSDTAPEGPPDQTPPELTFPAGTPAPVRPLRVAATASPRARMSGRRNRSAPSGQGQYRRAVPDPAPDRLAVDATIRAAAVRGLQENGRIDVRRSDLHRKECAGQSGTVILFVVDASGSMAARARMEAVKGAVIGLLKDAYVQRDEVGVIAFRGAQAELVLSPTGSIELAERALESLPTGGRTPLAHALCLASETIDRIRRSDAKVPVLLVLLTDGRANVALPGSEGDAWRQALAAATELAAGDVPALVLDTDGGFIRLGRTQELAQALAAEYLSLDDLTAGTLAVEIGQRRGSAATSSPLKKPTRPLGECRGGGS
jgi:magnesium chelatase subunit D